MENNREPYEPSPEEIAKECEKIRQTWTPAEKIFRTAPAYREYLIVHQMDMRSLDYGKRRKKSTGSS